MSDADRIYALEGQQKRLDGQFDTLKVVRPMMLTVVSVVMAALGLVLAAGVFVINNLAGQIQATNTRIEAVNTRLDITNAKIDAIPQRLAEEFRAMRAETAAQTAAIASSITAARQVQPQIVVMPMPEPPKP